MLIILQWIILKDYCYNYTTKYYIILLYKYERDEYTVLNRAYDL